MIIHLSIHTPRPDKEADPFDEWEEGETDGFFLQEV